MIDFQIKNNVAWITLNRPQKKNAINAAMRDALKECLGRVRDDKDIRVYVLSGAGGNFSSGLDLSEPVTDEVNRSVESIYHLCHGIYKPGIAAIQGLCLAQGAGLAFSADLRIAGGSARFGWPQVTRGFSSVSGCAILPRVVPRHRALYILLTGNQFDATEADRIGLLNRCVPDPDVLSEVERWALEIARNAPLAVQGTKEAVTRAAELDEDEAYELCRRISSSLFETQDAREGVLAFREKRAPVWQGC